MISPSSGCSSSSPSDPTPLIIFWSSGFTISSTIFFKNVVSLSRILFLSI
ncbi:hypothetical protein HanXRQr2_Chr16g0769261 [Helianthus annuus]|uniref:Uncharacterized protein n=1 Tax=Helianthus annuus TaxID=4232 RepID=A0A9K3DWW3_HELAN|nr:hypothetical protein HanXRQr2_Chr16g0769261 [Helianthus annuus]